MARTRAQNKTDNSQASTEPTEAAQSSPPKGKAPKRQHKDVDHDEADETDQKDGGSPAAKKIKNDKSKPIPQEAKSPKSPEVNKSKLDAVLEAHGTLPLQDSGLANVEEPSPDTILALVFNAMLTSARISHELAYKSVKCLLEVGYHDLEKLKGSTWQERTEVLAKGGYTRYREKTATALGELAEFVETKYGKQQRPIVSWYGKSVLI